MALQLITGVSGSGKSTLAFDMVTEVASSDRNKNVFVLVPDQFSQEATRILAIKNGGGIINIDVLSFRRLAYRALEEFDGLSRTVLSDEGKIMLLRKVISDKKNELKFFSKGLDRPGFLDECKSLLSEFIEYSVGDDEMEKLIEKFGPDSRTSWKLQDLMVLKHGLEERMGETYRMADELIPMLTDMVDHLSFLEDATICIDDFTGFTPVQYGLITALMKRCLDVIVTISTDHDDTRKEVFQIGNHTIKKLTEIAKENGIAVNDIIRVGDGKNYDSYRLKDQPELLFLEQNIFRYKKAVYSGENTGAVKVYSLRTEREECAFVSSQIGKLIRKEKCDPESIAVVTGDIDGYEPYLRRSFEELNIPFFIDKNKALGMNPLAEYILSFLNMMHRGFDRESVIRFMRGGLSPFSLSDADILENYMLASGRWGYKAFLEEWKYDVHGLYAEKMDFINSCRSLFIDTVGDAVSAIGGGKKSVYIYTKTLAELIVKNSCREKLEKLADEWDEKGDILFANEYRRIYSSMLDIFDELVELLGEEVVSLSDYIRILSAGIAEGVLGFVPPSRGRVVIGDLERTRLGEIDHLFFIGNRDDIFPKGRGSKGLLTDRERDMIEVFGDEVGVELAPNAEKLYEQEMNYIYRLVTKPKKTLTLTYIKTNVSGDKLRPSYLIERIEDMFEMEDDYVEFGSNMGFGDDEFPFKKDLNKSSVRLPDSIARDLYGDKIEASITRFEKYAACPYSHFLTYGLRLKEREEYEVEASDRGNIFHNSMEELYRMMNEAGLTWRTIDEDKLREFGEKCFDNESGEKYRDDVFGQNKRTEYYLKRMKRVYLKMLTFMREQMKVGDFDQIASEASFSADPKGPNEFSSPLTETDLGGGRKLRLRGRIDRIDAFVKDGTRYIKILDYKSSAKELDLNKVYYGLELQLFTYLAIAKSYPGDPGIKDNKSAAVLFQPIDQKEHKLDKKDADGDKYEFDEALAARPKGYFSDRLYENLDTTLAPGETSLAIPAKLKKDGDFGAGTRVIYDDDIEKITDYTTTWIRTAAKNIYKGDIRAFSYKYKQEDGCAYCPYSGVCGIEPKTCDDMKRTLESNGVGDDIINQIVLHSEDGEVYEID